VRLHDHVDFRADPEVIEVYARLDCKPGAGQQAPVVMGLVVVHVDAVAVHRFAQAVPRPVKDAVAVAGVSQDRSRRAIDFPPAHVLTGPDAALNQPDPGISCVADGGECPRHPLRNLPSRVPHPRDVRKHRPRPIQLTPEVEQDEVVGANGPGGGRRRQIVRVAGVFTGRDVWLGVADEALVGEPSRHQLLDVVFRGRHPVSRAARDSVERAILDAVELVRRGAMRGDLRVMPHRGEALHEVARRSHLDAEPTDQLHRASVHSRDVRDRAERRVFHGDAAHAGEQPLQSAFELLASGVSLGRARQMGQRARFNRVDQSPGLAGSGNEVVPSPRGEVATLPADAGHVERDRIDAPKIVEQPPVQSFGAQGNLNGGNVERRRLSRDSGHGHHSPV